MEDVSRIPAFKKIDKAIFESLDKFKQTPNYNNLLDLYNGLDEEQQKVAKGASILVIFLVPGLLIALMFWGNSKMRDDLQIRKNIVTRASEIIGQKNGLAEVKPQLISGNPIDSDSMMTSRLGSMFGGSGVDLSKIQVKQFNTTSISPEVIKSEADLNFTNFSTDELVNVWMAMIQQERFRISEVTIKRSPENNLLTGKFHAIHFASVAPTEGAE